MPYAATAYDIYVLLIHSLRCNDLAWMNKQTVKASWCVLKCID